jgi:hypothetical protein
VPRYQLAVNKWTTLGGGKAGPWYVPGNCDLSNPYFNSGVDGKTKLPVALQSGQAADANGTPGQGHSPNPPAIFGNHCIVKIGSNYYDPSYGVGPASTPQAYEKIAFKGSIQEDYSLHFYLHPLPSTIMCTGY